MGLDDMDGEGKVKSMVGAWTGRGRAVEGVLNGVNDVERGVSQSVGRNIEERERSCMVVAKADWAGMCVGSSVSTISKSVKRRLWVFSFCKERWLWPTDFCSFEESLGCACWTPVVSCVDWFGVYGESTGGGVRCFSKASIIINIYIYIYTWHEYVLVAFDIGFS